MRWRPVLIVTGVVALLVVAGAIVADIAARNAVEARLVQQVTSGLGAAGTVDVTLSGGRPLLLQVVTGRLDGVDVSADRLVLGGVDVTDVHVDATGVTVRAPYTAAEMTITGTVPVDVVEDRLAEDGLEADLSVDGQHLDAAGSVLGIPWSVRLAPRVDGDGLRADVVAADVAGIPVDIGALPAPVAPALTSLEVSLSGLPIGLTPRTATVVPGGVEVAAAGHDVALDTGG